MRLLFLFLFSPLILFSQSFKGGFVLALNGSQVTGDQMAGFHQGGIYSGFTVSRDFAPKWSARLELAYSAKGSRSVTDENNVSLGLWKTARFHYVDMPLTFAFKPFKNKGLAITAGPSLNYLFGGKIKNDIGVEVPASDVLKRFELALSGGIAYESEIDLIFFGRYSYSAISLTKNNAKLAAGYNSGFLNELITIGLIKEF
jgi:hypothetical protein